MIHNDKENIGCGGLGAPVGGAPDVDVLPFPQPNGSPSKVGIMCLSHIIVGRNTSCFWPLLAEWLMIRS
jgi:hypothetical protein